jgi:glyoxylase-like metal-dependent hydrolase (beta-lactamase superfamily II)
MIQIKSFVFNPFQENTYVLFDESKEAIIIDPGCFEKHEQQELKAFIVNEGLKVVSIYNTHCHIDHVLGNYFCKEEFKAPLRIPEKEVEIYKSVKAYSANFGINNYTEVEPDQLINEQEKIEFGNSTLEILFIPGHAPGHLVFFNKAESVCIVGDVIFQRSIGRTDLPGGDHNTLINGIKNVLFTLEDKMVLYPGHGPQTSIGEEKKYNPFVGENAQH